MSEDIRAIDKPFHVVVILDDKEGFHSGYFDKETAQLNCDQINKQAAMLALKSRYIVKENLPKSELKEA